MTKARHIVAFVMLLAPISSRTLRADGPVQLTPLAVGARMEDFGLRELDVTSGKLKRIVWLSDYVGPDNAGRPRKRLLLLSFFASWCKPCVAELLQLAQLQARYGAQGLQVLSVNFRRSGETFEATLAATLRVIPKSGLGYPVLVDRYTNRPQLVYLGSQAALPCNVLIEQSGRIAARETQLAALEPSIRAQLGLRGGE